MTDDERAEAIVAHIAAHRTEWEAWNSRPKSERLADLDKIEATAKAQGAMAGREMMRALGMPLVPDELCDPVDSSDAHSATRSDDIRLSRSEH